MKTRRRLLPSILIAALATLVFASTRATAPSTPKTSDQQPKPEYRAIAQMLADNKVDEFVAKADELGDVAVEVSADAP